MEGGTMTCVTSDCVNLYALTAGGRAAELYRQADASLDLGQEIRVLRVITALLFEDPEKHNAALVRVLPALIRAVDIQHKLTDDGEDDLRRLLRETGERVLSEMGAPPYQPGPISPEEDEDDEGEEEFPW
jgi:hypothetical protein